MLGELVIPKYFEIIRVTASFNPARFLTKKKKKKRKRHKQGNKETPHSKKDLEIIFAFIAFVLLSCALHLILIGKKKQL